MNARHPLSFITADPAVGATHHDDYLQAEHDADEAMLAEAQDQAPLIILAQLQGLKQPGDWFKSSIAAGGLWSPDEMLCEALNKDDATKSLVAELMTSPAALAVQKAVAEFMGRQYAMAIYTEARH